MPIKAVQVDPRYTSELNDAPTYRVDFWDASQASDEWRLEDALDVHEVQSWCEEHRHGRYYVLYVEYRNGDDIGLARLLGFDPTDPASPAYRNDVTEFNRAEGDAVPALYQREGR
jgi:hypothetical protein